MTNDTKDNNVANHCCAATILWELIERAALRRLCDRIDISKIDDLLILEAILYALTHHIHASDVPTSHFKWWLPQRNEQSFVFAAKHITLTWPSLKINKNFVLLALIFSLLCSGDINDINYYTRVCVCVCESSMLNRLLLLFCSSNDIILSDQFDLSLSCVCNSDFFHLMHTEQQIKTWN